MAEPITIQKLINASMDSDSLEAVVNGDDSTDVETRLGETYPSIKKAMALMFNSGILTSTPYDTYQELLDARIPLNSIGVVINDDDLDKNGFFQNVGGTLTRIKYDYIKIINDKLQLMSSYYDGLLESLVFVSDGDDIFEVSDKDGNVVFRIKKDGSIYAVGLDESVQDAVREIATEIVELSDVFIIADDEHNVYARLDSDAKLHLPHLNGSVQDCINKSAKQVFSPVNRHANYNFNSSVYSYFSNLRNKKPVIAPPPIHNFEQDFTINDTWINSITLEQPSEFVAPDSPYKNVSTFVHPSIAEFWGGLNGYRYYIALNPYGVSGEPIENPCIYGSNDLESLDLLNFIQQPLDAPDAFGQYLSDNQLTYDPNTGELIILWRDTVPNKGEGLWIKRTTDGINFTEKMPLIPVVSRDLMGGLLSPILLYNIIDSLWYLYTVRTNGIVEYRTAGSLTGSIDDWSEPTFITGADEAWHIELKVIGNKLVMMYSHRTSGDMRIGISSDWKTFTLSTVSNILVNSDKSYKPSFVPEFNDSDQMRLHVLWTSSNEVSNVNNKWRLYSAKTNYVNIGA